MAENALMVPENVGGIQNMGPEQARERSLYLVERIVECQAELMEVLLLVNNKGYYREYGCKTFDEWVEKELKHFGTVRKAQYFCQIQRSLGEKVGLGKEELKSVGWTKLREIASAYDSGKIDETQAMELVEKAKTSKRDEFANEVRKLKRGGEGRYNLTFSLDDDQYSTVELAIKTLVSRMEYGNPSRAITAMALESLASPMADMDQPIAFFLQALKKAYPEFRLFAVQGEEAQAKVEEFIRGLQQENVSDFPKELKK